MSVNNELFNTLNSNYADNSEIVMPGQIPLIKGGSSNTIHPHIGIKDPEKTISNLQKMAGILPPMDVSPEVCIEELKNAIWQQDMLLRKKQTADYVKQHPKSPTDNYRISVSDLLSCDVLSDSLKIEDLNFDARFTKELNRLEEQLEKVVEDITAAGDESHIPSYEDMADELFMDLDTLYKINSHH